MEQQRLDMEKQKMALDGKMTAKDIALENSKREIAGLPPLGQTAESIDSFTTTRNGSENIQCGQLANDWWKSVTGSSAGL